MHASTLSVSELTLQIKQQVELLFPKISVRGEISNFKRPGSGHLYFTLKDAGAQIPAVAWKSTAARLPRELRDGMDVIAEGRLEVYPPSGRYQLICSSITPAGEGALQQAFALLVEKLTRAGWFLPEHKKPLPRIPGTIGLITSPTGAVIEDMGKVLGRRFPASRVLLYPVKVQGREAAASVAGALDWFNATRIARWRADLLIVARGGGSLEDLQAFNEEEVAAAIHRSAIPVISAVGHETDVTIADMVADLRAGTPSIAAELAVPDSLELQRGIDSAASRLEELLTARLEGTERQIASMLGSYAFNRPLTLLEQFSERTAGLEERMQRALEATQQRARQRFEAAERHLGLLDYRKTLERGYVLVKKEGKPATAATLLRPDDRIELQFHDGTLPAVISGPSAP